MAKPTPFRIEWEAHEYEHKERSEDWFWAVGIITVSIAIAATIFGNVIFGILVLVSVFALALFINRPPENVRVIVDERGVTRDRIRYPFETLSSYWLDTEHPHPKILLSSQKPFLPIIVVPLSKEVDAEALDHILAQFLPERPHSLPFVEKLLEYLGF